MRRLLSLTGLLLASLSPVAAGAQPRQDIDTLAKAVEAKLIAWRRDIHQNPELGNREFRTAKLVAEHLRSLGLEVQTGVAHPGLVALLVGGTP